MIIGVPKETLRHEHRVGLTPRGVRVLTQNGHTVLVERGAGEAAHFLDRNFQEAGGQIVYGSDEAYLRSDLVCRVSPIPDDEVERVRPGSVVCAFHHLAVSTREKIERLMARQATLIGYEIIRGADGDLPVLSPMSDIAGQMSVHIAAHLLQKEAGGRGVLMGNVAGVPPPTILILGAGTVGRAAARQALAAGSHVIVLDVDLGKLKALHHDSSGRVVTSVPDLERLKQYTAIADVVIAAVLIPGARAPFIVTEEMVRAMKPGSVVIDVSIDQGGCVETSRPTTLVSPAFVAHGVVHYAVPNMTAGVPRTASRALANASLPYVTAVSGKGLARALADDPGLAQGVYLLRGRMASEEVGSAVGLPARPISDLLREGVAS